jgi:hypothetical protein
MGDNHKYDFKTLKVRPTTYERIVKCKGKVEIKNGLLFSFDGVINHLIDIFEK